MPPRFSPTVLCVLRASAIDSHLLQCRVSGNQTQPSSYQLSSGVSAVWYVLDGRTYLISHNRRLPKNIVEGRGINGLLVCALPPDCSQNSFQMNHTCFNTAGGRLTFTSNAYFSSFIVCHSARVFALHTPAEFWIAALWMGKNLVRLKAHWDGGAWNSLGGAAVPALCPLQEDVHRTGFGLLLWPDAAVPPWNKDVLSEKWKSPSRGWRSTCTGGRGANHSIMSVEPNY